jgi:hypothetical protein
LRQPDFGLLGSLLLEGSPECLEALLACTSKSGHLPEDLWVELAEGDDFLVASQSPPQEVCAASVASCMEVRQELVLGEGNAVLVVDGHPRTQHATMAAFDEVSESKRLFLSPIAREHWRLD